MIAILKRKGVYYFCNTGSSVMPLGTVDSDHAAKIIRCVGPYSRIGRSKKGRAILPAREMENRDNRNAAWYVRNHPERFECISYA